MARKTAENEEVAESKNRSRMYLHEAFVEWYADEFGVDLNKASAAEAVAAFASKRNDFRKSNLYASVRAEHASNGEKPKAKRASKATKKAPAKTARATKKSASPAKASRRSRKAEAAGGEEDPFD